MQFCEKCGKYVSRDHWQIWHRPNNRLYKGFNK